MAHVAPSQTLENIVEGFILVIAGAYMLVVGITSRFLINETHVVATQDERVQARATPLKRLVCVVFGFACIIYGLIRMLH